MQAAIKVPPDVHRRLKQFAEQNDLTMGAAITLLLENHRRRIFYERLEHERTLRANHHPAGDSFGLGAVEEYLGRLEARP